MKNTPIRLIIMCALLFCCADSELSAQHVKIVHDGKPVSLRGLSVVTDEVVWVSGSKGTVARSLDGGRHWEWMTVPGYEARDFRDIEAFDAQTAVVIAIAHPAHILRTADGGKTWKLVYENASKGMFLDAMDFSDEHHGVVVGDVTDGHLFLAHTKDGGRTWLPSSGPFQAADSTEGCFASSGTNIRLNSNQKYFFVTGGRRSRLISGSAAVDLPFETSKTSTGANSLALNDAGTMIVVGGDFAADTVRRANCFLSRDGGKTWTEPATSPFGYRSCVEFLSLDKIITCGLNGVDMSSDGGSNWRTVSHDSFHACRKAKKGKAVFLSGNNGKIGTLAD